MPMANGRVVLVNFGITMSAYTGAKLLVTVPCILFTVFIDTNDVKTQTNSSLANVGEHSW